MQGLCCGVKALNAHAAPLAHDELGGHEVFMYLNVRLIHRLLLQCAHDGFAGAIPAVSNAAVIMAAFLMQVNFPTVATEWDAPVE